MSLSCSCGHRLTCAVVRSLQNLDVHDLKHVLPPQSLRLQSLARRRRLPPRVCATRALLSKASRRHARVIWWISQGFFFPYPRFSLALLSISEDWHMLLRLASVRSRPWPSSFHYLYTAVLQARVAAAASIAVAPRPVRRCLCETPYTINLPNCYSSRSPLCIRSYSFSSSRFAYFTNVDDNVLITPPVADRQLPTAPLECRNFRSGPFTKRRLGGAIAGQRMDVRLAGPINCAWPHAL